MIFVLGCERSGSTWVANVLDAHPSVELWMEPFAEYAGIFPGFPGRFQTLEERKLDIADVVEAGYANLASLKYPYLYRPGRKCDLRAVDRYIVKFHSRILRCLGQKNALAVNQYRLLNLNAASLSVEDMTRKFSNPARQLTKELRLNFKTPFLNSLFPDAQYLIIIRHPGAQINSILKMFQRQRLSELKNALPSFFTCVMGSNKFDRYLPLFSEDISQQTLEDQLLIWWIINYDVLIRDCEKLGLNFRVVHHEELSEQPDYRFRETFRFLDLDYTSEVRNFVRVSSTGAQRADSPVDTYRDSAAFYRRGITDLGDVLKEKIKKQFALVELCGDLHCYAASD